MKKILIIEGNKQISELLRKQFKQSEHVINIIGCGVVSLKMIRENKYSIVLIGINPLNLNGIEITRSIRKFSNIPIIILSAKNTLSDILICFDAGVNDFLTIPYNFQELLLRIKAKIKFQNATKKYSIEYKNLHFFLESISQKKNIKLFFTKIEFEILKMLILNRGKIVTRDEIIQKIWKSSNNKKQNNLSVYIYYLRKKLNYYFEKEIIETIYRVGYIIPLAE